MNSFFKWLKNKLKEADYEKAVSDKPYPSTSSSSRLDSDGVQFTVYKADGGYAVEVSSYNGQYSERSRTNLYLITADQNFGERIAHILTFEAIKH
jgi:hypothetical protein